MNIHNDQPAPAKNIKLIFSSKSMISYKCEISQQYIRPKAAKPEAGIRAIRALSVQGLRRQPQASEG